MGPLTILDQITIASPCEADWAKMTGDDRTRFCADCSKHVYNIAAMTADEATALIIETQGNLCARIYKRHDGTVLTADCPVGLRKISAGRRLRRVLAASVVLPALAVAGMTALGMGTGRRQIDPFPTGPGVTWDDRIDWALVTLGVRQPRRAFAGKIVLPPGLLPPTSANGTTAACPTDGSVPNLPPDPPPFDLESKPVVDQ